LLAITDQFWLQNAALIATQTAADTTAQIRSQSPRHVHLLSDAQAVV
jgi:hypothetical protein